MDLTAVSTILEGKGEEPFGVLEALQDIQQEYGYLPEEAIVSVSETLKVSLLEVFRLANFYKSFSLEPRGRHLLTVCLGTACHVRGAPRLVDEVLKQLAVKPGGTTADGAFTVETVNCVGACALAPIVIVDGKYYDHMTPKALALLVATIRVQDQAGGVGPRKIESPEELGALRSELTEAQSEPSATITMCAGTACRACGCLPVAEAMESSLKRAKLTDEVRLRLTGCHGFCEQGPLAIIERADDDQTNLFYRHIKPEDTDDIIFRTLEKGELIDRLLYHDPVSGQRLRAESEIPFYAAQDRVLLGKNKTIDPKDINEYIADDGYSALDKVLTSMAPEEIIEEVKASGLKGRGGGGFSTGRKWEFCRATPAERRYVICNADEGDPGAYMDRSLLEGNPHSVLEGMIIGAYAMGAQRGYIYVRAEYPLAVEHIQQAIRQARDWGLLGENILDSGFSFDVTVARGGGAFICGEETALMASLEGRVGEPRPRPPYPAESGLWGKPTNINNVETWANVPQIISRGSAWFAAKGTEGSKGTKIFALTGHVRNTGLVEVDMGITLRQIIYDIGGGPQPGRTIKAVQTGGPSGGCLPVSQFDLPVDFDALTAAGSMMGSGGMVVMDDSACMVDIAKYFLTFLQDESCGKCAPCRVGVGRMLEIVTDITEGRGTPAQLELLEELAWTIAVGSLCALGKTAPNPVLSTLKHFREEYEAHIVEKRCPAGVCRELTPYVIDQEYCVQCKLCASVCPQEAIYIIAGDDYQDVHQIDNGRCNKCGICESVCALGAPKLAKNGALPDAQNAAVEETVNV